MNSQEICIHPPRMSQKLSVPSSGRRYSKENIDGMGILVAQVGSTTLKTLSSLPQSERIDLGSPKKELPAFLSKWSPNVALQEANDFIQKGKRLLKEILQGSITHSREVPGGSAYALNLLAWCLMFFALKKSQAHVQGSFAIEDPQGLLYRFFYQADGVGYRMSTHYPSRRLEGYFLTRMFWSQLGVNVRTGKMPSDQPHMLFGQVKAPPGQNEPLFFVKLEPHSPFVLSGPQPWPNLAPRLEVPLGDITRHTFSLAASGWTKFCCPENNDEADMAKEHPPVATLRAFETIWAQLSEEVQEDLTALMVKQGFGADYFSNAALYGISYMSRVVEIVKSHQNTWGIKPGHLENFNLSVSGLDHLEKRTGREVYVTHAEMLLLVDDVKGV